MSYFAGGNLQILLPSLYTLPCANKVLPSFYTEHSLNHRYILYNIDDRPALIDLFRIASSLSISRNIILMENDNGKELEEQICANCSYMVIDHTGSDGCCLCAACGKTHFPHCLKCGECGTVHLPSSPCELCPYCGQVHQPKEACPVCSECGSLIDFLEHICTTNIPCQYCDRTHTPELACPICAGCGLITDFLVHYCAPCRPCPTCGRRHAMENNCPCSVCGGITAPLHHICRLCPRCGKIHDRDYDCGSPCEKCGYSHDGPQCIPTCLECGKVHWTPRECDPCMICGQVHNYYVNCPPCSSCKRVHWSLQTVCDGNNDTSSIDLAEETTWGGEEGAASKGVSLQAGKILVFDTPNEDSIWVKAMEGHYPTSRVSAERPEIVSSQLRPVNDFPLYKYAASAQMPEFGSFRQPTMSDYASSGQGSPEPAFQHPNGSDYDGESRESLFDCNSEDFEAGEGENGFTGESQDGLEYDHEMGDHALDEYDGETAKNSSSLKV